MSAFTVERVLWEICCVPGRVQEFQAEPSAMLGQYPLSEKETALIRDFRVRGLADLGINQMLLMMTWNMLNGPDRIPDYLQRMNSAA